MNNRRLMVGAIYDIQNPRYDDCTPEVDRVDLLRWRDKMGGGGPFADRARHRNKEGHAPDGMHGRVWQKHQLDEERKERLLETMTVAKAARYLQDPDPVRQQAAQEFWDRIQNSQSS